MNASRVITRPMRAVAFVFAGLLVALVASAAPAASSDVCAQTITSDLVLTHDLVCSNNGVFIGASGVTLKLNGHSIIGPGAAPPFSGVIINSVSDIEIIGPGTIKNFRTGILIVESHDVEVSHVTIRDNGVAGGPFAGTSAGILISTNSYDVEIEESKITGNAAGVYFKDATSTGNTVEENKITWNAIGIRGSIVGNTIEDNKFKHNGVDFAL